MHSRPAIQSLLEGQLVLTASRRLAYSLRLDYARAMHEQQHRVWPTPEVLPLASWLRQVWNAIDGDQRRQQLLSEGQTRLIWRQIIEAHPHGTEILNARRTATSALRTWQRVNDYQIPLEEIAADASPEAQAWVEWAQIFRSQCAVNAWLDDASLIDSLSQLDVIPDRAVLLTGFHEITPVLARWLDKWRAAKVAVAIDAPATSQNEVLVTSAFDADAELALSARWARAQLNNGVITVGVVVPELKNRAAAVARVFETVFSPSQRFIEHGTSAPSFAVAVGKPLRHFPLVHCATLALQIARGGADSRVVGQFLRSVFLRGAPEEEALRAAADVRLRREARDRWDLASLERWAGVTGCLQLELSVRAALVELREFRGPASSSEWSRRFLSILAALGWRGGRPLDSDERQTAQKFQEAIGAFGALDDLLPRLDFAAALAEFEQLLLDTTFEPETGATPVLVIDAETASGMSFDACWVMSLDAAKWPPPIEPDPFIPADLQRRYKVSEASSATMLQRSRQQLAALASAAEHVVFSWATHDGDTALQMSPLLREYPEAPLICPTLVTPIEQMFAARPSLEQLADDRVPAMTTIDLPRGATAIELQARCAFRAQSELRLHASPLEIVSTQITALDRGRLVHRVMEEVWTHIGDHATLITLDEGTLLARVRASAQRHATALLTITTRVRERLVAIEVDWISAAIVQLLNLENQRAPFRVRRSEQREPFPIAGYRLNIQPDRIDELQAGGAIVIDYKTGASIKPGHWIDRRPGRPARAQLPLYAIAHADGLQAIAAAVLAPGITEFRGFGTTPGLVPGVGVYPEKLPNLPVGAGDWAGLMQHWQVILESLVVDYAQGDASVDPLPQECRTCHLMSLCRISDRPLLADVGEQGSDDE